MSDLIFRFDAGDYGFGENHVAGALAPMAFVAGSANADLLKMAIVGNVDVRRARAVPVKAALAPRVPVRYRRRHVGQCGHCAVIGGA
ncbi:MAG: hypothetical protein OSB46_07835 [Alphaproteobacteria bacterium]|nr:hypothetical protein [Alphaproteobacteria bacterium]